MSYPRTLNCGCGYLGTFSVLPAIGPRLSDSPPGWGCDGQAIGHPSLSIATFALFPVSANVFASEQGWHSNW